MTGKDIMAMYENLSPQEAVDLFGRRMLKLYIELVTKLLSKPANRRRLWEALSKPSNRQRVLKALPKRDRAKAEAFFKVLDAECGQASGAKERGRKGKNNARFRTHS